VLGYAEIGRTLLADPETRLEGNPYRRWIEEYGGADFQRLARESSDHLDRLARARLTEARFPEVARTFAQATRLEAQFWQMGLTLAP
ncbi:MAG: thiaminase II, partial [Alphaproteobacteria bacterium]|nr:thiaminase II [Alphaproteobacteria bacterium]